MNVAPDQTDFWGLTKQDHDDALVYDAARAVAGEFDPIPLHLIDRYYGSTQAFVVAYAAQAEKDEADAAKEDAPAWWRERRQQNAAACRAAVAKVLAA